MNYILHAVFVTYNNDVVVKNIFTKLSDMLIELESAMHRVNFYHAWVDIEK